MAGKLRYWKE
jgi:hypothetical protein